MDEHVLLCLVGRTCAGKSRLAKELSDRCGYKQIISYTTRAKRNEQDLDHIFVDEETYQQMKANNQVAAETMINGFRYWTVTQQLYENDIYTIDPVGINVLRNLDTPGLKLVVVYINIDDETRERRSITRGDNRNTFRARNFDERHQFKEFLQQAGFDYAVLNNNLANAYSVLKWICDVEGVWKNKEAEDDNLL